MASHNGTGDYGKQLGIKDQRDTTIQIILSAVLGLGAFFAFCILRPRWPGLYAARKQQRGEASPLPILPDTMFGWIPTLWRITEQQVLASAGLDAYVFLRFFKLAVKFLAVTLFFALAVLKPVHDAYPDKDGILNRNHTRHDNSTKAYNFHTPKQLDSSGRFQPAGAYDKIPTNYLWMYLVFAYVFTGVAMYLLVTETERIIAIRQEYLGSQSTITDRTMRLSGIHKELRSEDKIKEFIERLQIGKVESVTLCKNWQELDDHMAQRDVVLRKLEEAWTVYLGARRIERTLETLPIVQPSPPGPGIQEDDEEEEDGRLLGNPSSVPYARDRPKISIRYGFLKLHSRKIDAIDYYEEKLRRLDDEIKDLRKKEFEPTALAFVTMDSVASCQMAVQAVLDPSPSHLLARQSPAPGDIVWSNTYVPRKTRMTRAWTVTAIITLLTVFWSVLLVPLATALNLEAIHRVWPELADVLEAHLFAKSLVQTQLPTLLTSLLFVIVPYLYDWLSSYQGMSSQGDVELSVISKNFFFVFFNYFIVFTVLGVFSNFYKFFEQFQDSLKDTTRIAYTLARSLQELLPFYTNLVILQGLGLFPFRLLEIGSVVMYPIYRMGCKTPRDYAELVQPPMFYYSFFMPQVMLIFIICIVYSVIRDSWRVLLAGLAYFMIGGFVYKYQLLYAMDHRQQSTGRAWLMICDRMIIGLILFQLTTAGQLALKVALVRSLLIVPLLAGTIWFSYVYSRTYTPLMKFIALGSIERALPDESAVAADPDGWGDEGALRYEVETCPGNTVDESVETGMRFINPNLIAPLQEVWISDKAARDEDRNIENGTGSRRRLEAAINGAV